MRNVPILATGTVLVMLALTGCASSSNVTAETTAVSSAEASPAPTFAGGGLGPTADLAAEAPEVDQRAALDTAMQAHPGMTLTSLGLEFSRHWSAWVWKIDLRNGAVKQELRIDASSGEILQDESGTEDGPVEAIDPAALNTADALAAAQKLQPGTVESWELEWDNGSPRYEVSIRTGSDDVDVHVDVATGNATLDD